jgi:ethanolamine utilization protein EutQ (cupin superfamily)
MHVLSEGVEVYAGLSRFPAEWNEPVRWILPARETFIVLEGEARIEIAGGPTLELTPGSMASLPKGAETTWYLPLRSGSSGSSPSRFVDS